MRQFSKTLSVRLSLLGAWCSGITFALHAKGPGFEPRRLHYLFAPAQSFCKFLARQTDYLFIKSKGRQLTNQDMCRRTDCNLRESWALSRLID